MVLALQGGMAVGKTTAARYVAAHAPGVTVFFEDNAPALAALRGRRLDKHRFADYCEIQRAFIQQEIDRYARAAACPCALVDLGPQEIEFYTLHYPASIGQDWPVEQVLAPELAALRAAGLEFAYLGLESGNDALLKKINKGVTAAQQIEAGQKLKSAGFTLSVTAINGLAGSNGDWQAHAKDTAAALNAMRPDFIALLTLRIYTGTPMAEWIERGELVMPTPMELIRESKLFLEHIDCPGAVFRSNHASNYLALAGTLNEDRARLIRQCEDALAGNAPLRKYVELGR